MIEIYWMEDCMMAESIESESGHRSQPLNVIPCCRSSLPGLNAFDRHLARKASLLRIKVSEARNPLDPLQHESAPPSMTTPSTPLRALVRNTYIPDITPPSLVQTTLPLKPMHLPLSLTSGPLSALCSFDPFSPLELLISGFLGYEQGE